MRETALIVGATSGIGRALAHQLAREGLDLVLAGRDTFELERQAADLALRHGVRAHSETFEARAFDCHPGFVTRCLDHAGGSLAGVALCQGSMPTANPMPDAGFEPARQVIEVNYASVVSLLERLVPSFEAQGHGWICAITSVAGDRGRPSNYLYGSTKAAVSTYLAGLRARLARRGVHVLDVRPGFIDTGLTWGLPRLFLVASPERVARDIRRGIRRKRAVVYTPGFWRWIMRAIRSIPNQIFSRLEL